MTCVPGLKNLHSTEYFGFQKSTRYDACWQTILIARRFQLFYTPAAAAAANVQKMTNKRYATSIHGQNLSKTYKSVKINPGSTLFPIQKILTSSGTSAEKVMGATGFDCPAIFWARSAQLFGS